MSPYGYAPFARSPNGLPSRWSVMRQTVNFLLNDQTISLDAVDPTMTLLDWLRIRQRLTGTKEGCGEGDCGACTVLVGRLRHGRLRYEAINSCIHFVAVLDACHVVTVEHLKAAMGRTHPVQQAMMELHGSQCGFCTPGIVMSLMALWLNNERAPARSRIEDGLAGNLCRCTGYGPIVAALDRAYEIASPSHDPLAAGQAAITERLKALADQQVVEIGDGARKLLAPATADQLADLTVAHPDATIVAGATDVGLWITKMLQRPACVISLGRVAELDRIENRDDALVIGALASI